MASQSTLAKTLRSPVAMNLAGIVAAFVIFASSNVLSSRFFERWDVTSDGLYTLSPVTIETLSGLRDEVSVVVFLSSADPLSSSARYLLDSYRTHTDQLRVRFVDPDRNPAEFISLQREYGIFEGRTDNGRLATEASIVVARGEKRWYIATDDIIVFDEETGNARPRLEAVLTEGIVNVLGREQVRLCFTQGHQELAMNSGGPQGLSEYRRRLQQSNYEAQTVDLAVADPVRALEGCDLVLVVGPLATFSQPAAQALRQHLDSGGSLLLAVGPLVDEQGNINDPGLSPVLRQTGLAFSSQLVFERDETLRLPVGFGGEVFLATPELHPTTRGLVVGSEVRQRVVVQLTQGLQRGEESVASVLLRSSEDSIRIGSFRGLQAGEFVDEPRDNEQSNVLAAAVEFPSARRPGKTNPARLVVLGTPSVFWSSTWLEPSLLGTRRFVENLTSWLAAQPALVSVPEKAEQPAGLFLTEQSLGEVQRYVLLYVPLSVVLLGAFVILRRRRQVDEGERQQSEVEAHEKKDASPRGGDAVSSSGRQGDRALPSERQGDAAPSAKTNEESDA